mmetsp:Transcript_17448/g.43432  ORF Transcript_17448/g.43432 Transcript_17448/m.43432 type:complete len:336 (+) Transcript_17448:2782-3789(+)
MGRRRNTGTLPAAPIPNLTTRVKVLALESILMHLLTRLRDAAVRQDHAGGKTLDGRGGGEIRPHMARLRGRPSHEGQERGGSTICTPGTSSSVQVCRARAEHRENRSHELRATACAKRQRTGYDGEDPRRGRGKRLAGGIRWDRPPPRVEGEGEADLLEARIREAHALVSVGKRADELLRIWVQGMGAHGPGAEVPRHAARDAAVRERGTKQIHLSAVRGCARRREGTPAPPGQRLLSRRQDRPAAAAAADRSAAGGEAESGQAEKGSCARTTIDAGRRDRHGGGVQVLGHPHRQRRQNRGRGHQEGRHSNSHCGAAAAHLEERAAAAGAKGDPI